MVRRIARPNIDLAAVAVGREATTRARPGVGLRRGSRTSIAEGRHLRNRESITKIGVIGAGRIGGTAARLFAGAGHEVAISNSRGPASLAALVDSLGPNVRAETPEGAARFGEVVLLAIPWRRMNELPPGDRFAGKIVIDAMNPYNATGQVIDLGARTSSEEVAGRMPNARVVKAFNTMYWKTLESGSRPAAPAEDRLAIFLAGDDKEAKAVVATLIEAIGFAPIDTGSLRDGGRRQRPHSPIYGRPLTARQARDLVR